MNWTMVDCNGQPVEPMQDNLGGMFLNRASAQQVNALGYVPDQGLEISVPRAPRFLLNGLRKVERGA
jgi:hypothetical protein